MFKLPWLPAIDRPFPGVESVPPAPDMALMVAGASAPERSTPKAPEVVPTPEITFPDSGPLLPEANASVSFLAVGPSSRNSRAAVRSR